MDRVVPPNTNVRLPHLQAFASKISEMLIETCSDPKLKNIFVRGRLAIDALDAEELSGLDKEAWVYSYGGGDWPQRAASRGASYLYESFGNFSESGGQRRVTILNWSIDYLREVLPEEKLLTYAALLLA